MTRRREIRLRVKRNAELRRYPGAKAMFQRVRAAAAEYLTSTPSADWHHEDLSRLLSLVVRL